MKCPICGAELTKEDIEGGICPFCGCYLDESSLDIESDLEDEEDEQGTKMLNQA